MKYLSLTITLLALGTLMACAAAPQDDDSGRTSVRPNASLPIAAKTTAPQDSCQSGMQLWCGGQANGSCWCDDACVDYGDCCADKQDACDLGATLNVADVMAPNQLSYPVYVDIKEERLIDVPLRLSIEGGEGSWYRETSTGVRFVIEQDGYHHDINPTFQLNPCSIEDSPACHGSATLSVTTMTEPPELIARRTIQIGDSVAFPSAASCTGVGNVWTMGFLTSYLGAVGPATMTNHEGEYTATLTHNVGLWDISMYRQTTAGAIVYLVTVTLEEEPQVGTLIQLGGDTTEQYISYQGGCSAGVLRIDAMEKGHHYGNEHWRLSRLSMSWATQCTSFQGTKPKTWEQAGCAHYDASNPVLIYEN